MSKRPYITYHRRTEEAGEHRRAELAKILAETPNVTNVELARVLHCDRDTIARDRTKIMDRVKTDSQPDIQAYRDRQLAEIEADRQELESLQAKLIDKMILPEDAIELALKIIDRRGDIRQQEMRLTGTAAPTKSISANINVNPEHSEEYLLFREACAGLTDDQLHEVYAIAKALPRAWVAPPIEANFPPPMVKALPESTDETQ